MSDIAEYWIGENVDYPKLWNAYNHGKDGYMQKFQSMKVSLVRIEFDLPHTRDPLFNLEAVYKSLKGLYYDFKRYCLTNKNEYDEAGPLFVYSIERGSGDWLLYVEWAYVIPFIYLLAKASLTCLEAYHEPYKIKKTKLECEMLEHKLADINREREENNKGRIEQANMNRLIEDRKSVFDNLLSGQQIKKIVLENHLKQRVTIHFNDATNIEIEPKKPEPPTRSK